MRRFLALQTAASLLVLSVIGLAEAAALLLAEFPGSVFLWYLNQDVFGFVETARNLPLTSMRLLFTPATFYWVICLALSAVLVYRLGWRLGAALVSHACLLLAGILTYAWAAAVNYPETASLEPVLSMLGLKGSPVLMFALAAALLAAVFAHLTYLAGIFSLWPDRNHDGAIHSHRLGGDSDLRNFGRPPELPHPE